MSFLKARAMEQHSSGEGPLQIMYGIDGRHELEESDRKSTRLNSSHT